MDKKAEAMYQWSGGTDYTHLCCECRNCVKMKKGSRTVYKCLSYGNTDSTASDWRAGEIACNAFNQPPPEVPVMETGIGRKRKPDKGEMKGQLSIEDFLGVGL